MRRAPGRTASQNSANRYQHSARRRHGAGRGWRFSFSGTRWPTALKTSPAGNGSEPRGPNTPTLGQKRPWVALSARGRPQPPGTCSRARKRKFWPGRRPGKGGSGRSCHWLGTLVPLLATRDPRTASGTVLGRNVWKCDHPPRRPLQFRDPDGQFEQQRASADVNQLVSGALANQMRLLPLLNAQAVRRLRWKRGYGHVRHLTSEQDRQGRSQTRR